ncbi:penicillin acylase family protein [Bowmanella sp. Y26]|uniref:penicillin acylase family protein n=1 Tax=Bowmanella yangjiangensis TaxID=2811230 RepID=UPI001BDC9B5B|nr:penicillin acylase family protein [Bowmanella yangjiangensis]MBT1063080.1 penicillin acylase family protein [Bowmanella yangjiangensis]
MLSTTSRILKITFLGLLSLILLVLLGTYLLLRASLPQLDGQQSLPDLQQEVTVTRDESGMAVFTAQNRLDLARAVGFVHGQERFFQMDLLRRNSAGELSALFGEAAVNRDKEIRLHRFRDRAERILATMPEEHQKIIQAYTEGVNQGLEQLGARSFEYYLLSLEPAKWQPADTMLTLYSMYLDLQHHDGRRDFSLSLMKAHLPADLYAFLHPEGSQWDAPIDDSLRSTSPLPSSGWPSSNNQQLVMLDNQPEDRTIGSNNWAVGGALSPYQAGILADDMHLGLRVPNIWFKAQFNWQQHGQAHQVTGVTLPGTPLMVVGSNGKLAWGFTNSYGDWSDLIRLKLNEAGDQYLTPAGYQPFDYVSQQINIKGAPTQTIQVKETIWGPVVSEDEDGTPLALRWVAHDNQGANLNLIGLELAENVEQGADVGATAGMPAQNLMMADSQGNIGWTISGPMPIRYGFDGRYIADWSDGSAGWSGYRSAEDYPKVINPTEHRLWTANSRVVGGDMYDKIGDGGYALGARNQQIRDGLRNKDRFNEQDLLDIQLDDRAVFLTPWRDFMLSSVLPGSHHPQKALVKEALQNWTARASEHDLGYLLVRQFRLNLRDKVYQDLNRLMLEHSGRFNFNAVRNQMEAPLWQMVSEQPAHLIPSDFDSWQELFNAALTDSLAKLDADFGDWRTLTWGQFNAVDIRHPLSAFVPLLGNLTDMPKELLAGDSFMPRVAQSSSGASQRLVVAPGHEDKAIFHMPSSQAGHPLSPYFGVGHEAWRSGQRTGLLPGPARYNLTLQPIGG